MNAELFRKALEKVDKSHLSKVEFISSTTKFFENYLISEEGISLLKEFSFTGTV